MNAIGGFLRNLKNFYGNVVYYGKIRVVVVLESVVELQELPWMSFLNHSYFRKGELVVFLP